MSANEDSGNKEPDTDSEVSHEQRETLSSDVTEERYRFPEWFREIGRWRADPTR